MIKNLNRKSILPYVLAIIAIVIWGHNGYKIFKGILAVDESQEHSQFIQWKPQTILSDSLLKTEVYTYSGKNRDPFKSWFYTRPKKTASPKKIIKTKPPVIIPELRFTGLLNDESGPMAIIEDPAGNTHFVKSKGEIAGVEILSIASDGVKCRYQKKTFVLELKR